MGKYSESNYYLHEAMEMVLKEQDDNKMSMQDLSDEIWSRGLYKQKSGAQAPDYQMRLRAIKHKDKFEIIDNEYIKLI